MNLNCPICNQAGLPDYRVRHTVCPQCNADLKPYLLLRSIAKMQKETGKKTVLIGALIVCCLLSMSFLLKNSRDYHRTLAANGQTIQLLQDSIDTYKNEIKNRNHTNQTIHPKEKEQTVSYTIKKGDCMWKIARLFYGKGRLYKKIEEDNHLQRPYSLKAGQLLIIKISN